MEGGGGERVSGSEEKATEKMGTEDKRIKKIVVLKTRPSTEVVAKQRIATTGNKKNKTENHTTDLSIVRRVKTFDENSHLFSSKKLC